MTATNTRRPPARKTARRMAWVSCSVALLLLANAGSAGNGAQGTARIANKTIVGKAADATPESRAEAGLAIDAAVAAALIGAISTQFGERDVEVKLDRVAMDPQNLIDIRVSGEGRLQIGKEDEWLPFDFTTLYDSLGTTVTAPRLTLGGDDSSEDIQTNSAMALQLRDRVDVLLRQEFGQQSPRFSMEKLTMSPTGKRYARVAGLGTAQFGKEGGSGASVNALYDRRTGEWVRVAYELGSTANRGADTTQAP